MISHVHLIIGTNCNKMEDIMRDYKSNTSSELKKSVKNIMAHRTAIVNYAKIKNGVLEGINSKIHLAKKRLEVTVLFRTLSI